MEQVKLCHCSPGESNPRGTQPGILTPLPHPNWDVLSGPQTLLAVWETTVGGQPSPGRMASPRMEECFTCDLLPTFFPGVKLRVKSQRFFRPYARLSWPESLVSLETKLCPPKCSEKLTVPLTPVCPQGVVFMVHAASPQRDFPKECSSQQDQRGVPFLGFWSLSRIQMVVDLV